MRKIKVNNVSGIIKFIQDNEGTYLQFIPDSASNIDVIKGEDLLRVLPQEISSLFSLESHPYGAGVTIKFEPQLLVDKILQSSLFSDIKEQIKTKLKEITLPSEDNTHPTDVFFALMNIVMKKKLMGQDEIDNLLKWKKQGGNLQKINSFLKKKIEKS